jgi:hypothetical protein
MSRPLLQDPAGMLLMGLLYMEVVKYIALVVREKSQWWAQMADFTATVNIASLKMKFR